MDQFQSAADYLAYNGLNLDSLLDRPQPNRPQDEGRLDLLSVVRASLPRRPVNTLWNVTILNQRIASITPYDPEGPDVANFAGAVDANGRLLAPSLCHAHIHLDKCFLLHDEKFADLQISSGDFDEALRLTNVAKKRFTEEDLLRRGRRLLTESVQAGVSSMRAFVELDEVVESRCLTAALKLKVEFGSRCNVQICAFAQLALFSGPHASHRRVLLERALEQGHVEAIGSTPYVEDCISSSKECIEYSMRLAIQHKKHLDLHLDYNLDPGMASMVDVVIDEFHRQRWTLRNPDRTICLGHCTRLALFDDKQWQVLANRLSNLPIHFIGLPTSDIYIQGRECGGMRPRGTLHVPDMIQQHGIAAAVAINNVSNAFTPYGSCDPLALASMGVGLYHAGRTEDAELLYVSRPLWHKYHGTDENKLGVCLYTRRTGHWG